MVEFDNSVGVYKTCTLTLVNVTMHACMHACMHVMSACILASPPSSLPTSYVYTRRERRSLPLISVLVDMLHVTPWKEV